MDQDKALRVLALMYKQIKRQMEIANKLLADLIKERNKELAKRKEENGKGTDSTRNATS